MKVIFVLYFYYSMEFSFVKDFFEIFSVFRKIFLDILRDSVYFDFELGRDCRKECLFPFVVFFYGRAIQTAL